MGILNTTPDSFFDGGRWQQPEAAAERARVMIEQGADVIDIGGESTRPKAASISLEEELERVLPAIRLISELSIPISIDTTKSAVARQAVAAGASIINDVSGGRADPTILKVAAETGAGLILMHSRGTPQTMQDLARYDSLIEDVLSELSTSLEAAKSAGVDPEQIAIDPGFGFAKTTGQSLELLKNFERFQLFNRPVLAGISRKSFMGAIVDRTPENRLAASLAAQCLAALRGCDIIRTHDVCETVQTVKMLNAIVAAQPLDVR